MVNLNNNAASEQIVAAFAAEFENGRRPAIETYLTDWLERQRLDLLRQLVAVEWRQLSSVGEPIDRESYATRFPELAEELDSIDDAVDDTVPMRSHSSSTGSLPSAAENSATEAWRSAGPSPHSQLSQREFDDYEILDEIARGGMGVVFRARQKQANRMVAIKMILAGQTAGPEYVERFYKEAEAAANLDHPGIVPVYDVGEMDGQPFFSMAFVEGDSLSDKIRHQPLVPRNAAELMTKVADAVQYAHDHQIVHRDLKPGNILLDAEGTPRVTDFGLAKQLEATSQLTATGQILGTPSYMPPEQARGEIDAVNARSDVYSLGAILYAALTGRSPHQAATPTETLRLVLEQEPAAPRQLVPSIPRYLETICLKALAKSPTRRYPTAAAFRDDLQRFLNKEPILARRVNVLEKSWMWCQRNPSVCLTSAAIVAVAIGGVFAAYEWRMGSAADVLVDSLAESDPQGVTAIIEKLRTFGDRADARLSNLADSDPQDEASRRHRLHAQMAIAGKDRLQVQPLMDGVMSARLAYVEPITTVLKPYREQVVESAWPVLQNAETPDSQRFRAGLVLAELAPDDDRWTEELAAFLIRIYMQTNPEFHPIARRCLTAIRAQLKPHVLAVYRDRTAPPLHLGAAAILVRDYYPDDEETLLSLLMTANAEQFLTLYPLVGETSKFDGRLLAKLEETPTAETGTPARVQLGAERATAAITMLRRGHHQDVLPILRVSDDPESLTQFVDRCLDREVAFDDLVKCWRLLPGPEQRLDMSAAERRAIDAQHYGLLLAMGEYPRPSASQSSHAEIVEDILQLFENDPSSGVHAAAGWLLREWGRDDPQLLQQAKQLEERVVPPSDEREWFTIALDLPSDSNSDAAPRHSYQTYVVFAAGEYEFGSPDDELRQGDEVRHRQQVDRFAILEREITREEYEASGHKIGQIERFSATSAHVSLAFNWFDAVRYCRWLNEQTGFAEQQPYAAPESLDADKFPSDPRDDLGPAPKSWPLDLTKQGFRLPTEHEWEVMCRAGTRTAFSFGGDYELLGRYGWFQDNSGKVGHRPRELRPNLRGVFDTHGNGYEWVHDWDGGYESSTAATGPADGEIRMTRGGSWFLTPPYCRSSFRYAYPATNRNVDFAVRPARTMPPRDRE